MASMSLAPSGLFAAGNSGSKPNLLIIHTEHHTFPGLPCYALRRFHALTREHWERPQTLVEA